MADRTVSATWPGISQVESAQYTLSHGISPGCAILTILPQNINDIALQGNLTLSDGVGSVTLRGCKVSGIRENLDDGGRTWTVEILDRRWRWRDAPGYISGVYNVPDASRDVTRPPEGFGPYLAPAQLYVPWTIRTPHQLMKLCLDAMGEVGYVINAPNVTYPLPAINWDYSNPSQSLSSLVETLGCRVIYRPDTNVVWIVPLGVGGRLPDEDMVRESPSVKSPQRPDTIVCVGAPVKFQMEWVLEAVGEEWDGRLKPIEYLSYAPELRSARHTIRITPSDLGIGANLRVVITFDGVDHIMQVATATTSVSDACTLLFNKLNAELAGLGIEVFNEGGATIKVVGPISGKGFDTITSTLSGTGKIRWDLVIKGGSLKGRWIEEGPPVFGKVQRTDELTYTEAVRLAQQHVYRTYRIVNVNIENGQPRAFVPQFGLLDLEGGIHRVVLLNEQINQVVPTAEDAKVFGRDGEPISRDFYSGLFKVKPARCYGVYEQRDAGLQRNLLGDHDSDIDDEVLVDFSINAERKIITFSEPVFRFANGGYHLPADIRLRCACHIRSIETNQLVRYVNTYTFPGPKLGTQPAVIRHDDIEYLVKPIYGTVFTIGPDIMGTVVRHTISEVQTNIGEVIERADYYLRAAAAKYQTPASGERTYNGIKPIFCDGAIQQVSWSINDSGAETVASLNTEHAIYAPQYPERVRIEYLRNLSEQAAVVPNIAVMAAPGVPGAPGYVGGGG